MGVCDRGGWQDLDTFLDHYRGTRSPEAQHRESPDRQELDVPDRPAGHLRKERGRRLLAPLFNRHSSNWRNSSGPLE